MRVWPRVLGGVLVGAALVGAAGAQAMLRSSTPSAAAPSDSATADGVAKAQTLLKSGRIDQALPMLLQLAANDPGSADVQNLLGYSYRQLKQYDRALPYYLKALQLDPSHEGALEYLGELYLQTGDSVSARRMLDRLDELCASGTCEARDMLSAALTRKAAP
jgi:Flp pilus assembly protein TadD